MATRQIKMPEKMPEKDEGESSFEHLSQRKRPESGRFLLQVDRQTKGSYTTVETARAVGLAIKQKYPVVWVSVYDTVETQTIPVELPAAS